MTLTHHRTSLATAMQLDATRFDAAGVTVVGGDDRRGTRLVSHYRVGEHSVLWADPDVAGSVISWDGSAHAVSFADFGAWALDRGAVRLGAAYEHVLVDVLAGPTTAPEVFGLDGGDDAVVGLARGLFDSCSDADREQADFEPDALDEHLAGWIEGDRLCALAGGRRWEPRPGFFDLGVLVHPDERRRGCGRQAIAAVVSAIVADGGRPLYRCGVEHEASWRLCRSLGFVPVLELEAFRWPDAS